MLQQFPKNYVLAIQTNLKKISQLNKKSKEVVTVVAAAAAVS